MWELIIVIGLPVFGIVVFGLIIGGHNERAHLRSLDARERTLSDIRVCNLKRDTDPHNVREAHMVMGQVVIATDYFKSFATSLRKLVGGEMRAAETLLRRGRREALVRLLEQASAMGATEVWNVRFGFSNISQMRGKQGAMSLELLAWGTAVVREAGESQTTDAA